MTDKISVYRAVFRAPPILQQVKPSLCGICYICVDKKIMCPSWDLLPITRLIFSKVQFSNCLRDYCARNDINVCKCHQCLTWCSLLLYIILLALPNGTRCTFRCWVTHYNSIVTWLNQIQEMSNNVSGGSVENDVAN